MKSNVDAVIQNFADFLTMSWDSFAKSWDHHIDIWDKKDILEDWMEANWEILVVLVLSSNERSITEYTASSHRYIRFPKPEMNKLEFEPFCKPINSSSLRCHFSHQEVLNLEKMDFIKFVNLSENGYEEESPFNSVMLQDEACEIFILPRNMVSFDLRRY